MLDNVLRSLDASQPYKLFFFSFGFPGAGVFLDEGFPPKTVRIPSLDLERAEVLLHTGAGLEVLAVWHRL